MIVKQTQKKNSISNSCSVTPSSEKHHKMSSSLLILRHTFLRLYFSGSQERVVIIKTGLDDMRFDSLQEKQTFSSPAGCPQRFRGPTRLVLNGHHVFITCDKEGRA
jgi:hypothetical protein